MESDSEQEPINLGLSDWFGEDMDEFLADLKRMFHPTVSTWEDDIWPFANWHWDTLFYGDIALGELSAVVLLDIARFLDSDGRRTMSHTCSRFWNLLVDNKTIDRRVVEEDNYLHVTGANIKLSSPAVVGEGGLVEVWSPDKEFTDLASFKTYMEKVSIYRKAEKMWIYWKQSSESPFSACELIAAMEGYSTVFGLRNTFTSGLKLQLGELLTKLRTMEFVEAVVVDDDDEHPGIKLMTKYSEMGGTTVPRETRAFRVYIDKDSNVMKFIPEELPDVFDYENQEGPYGIG